MPTLDSQIDELYQGSLESFTGSRNALAKTLAGDAKKRVMALAKPLAVPWLVNQTYWHARETYNELMSAGKTLRAAQLGGLQGRSTDVRAASEHHEQALAGAMKAALKLAAERGVQPQADLLRRMFEAVSTRATLPAEHGRFVKVIEPSGFEALSGFAIAAPLRAIERVTDRPSSGKGHSAGSSAPSAKEMRAAKAAQEEERRRERERTAAARRRQAAIVKAKAKVAAASQAENRARFEWERAKKTVEAAERALGDLLSQVD